MRNVDSDIRGLVKIFETCFDRNSNPIPKYDGVEQTPSINNIGLISENLNGDLYKYHLKEGRDLAEILLACAYNLGAEQVVQGRLKETKEQLSCLIDLTKLITENKKP